MAVEQTDLREPPSYCHISPPPNVTHDADDVPHKSGDASYDQGKTSRVVPAKLHHYENVTRITPGRWRFENPLGSRYDVVNLPASPSYEETCEILLRSMRSRYELSSEAVLILQYGVAIRYTYDHGNERQVTEWQKDNHATVLEMFHQNNITAPEFHVYFSTKQLSKALDKAAPFTRSSKNQLGWIRKKWFAGILSRNGGPFVGFKK